MSDLLLRTPRALPLEYEDVDANFENLNADKLQRTTNAGVTGTITSSATTSTITGLSSNNLAVGMRLVKTAGTGVLGTASTITAVDQFNDTITVAASSSHTSGSITFTAAPVLNGAYIDAVSIGATTPGTGAFTTLNVSGNATFDTNTLFVDASGNFVGIGTAAPSQKLTISSNTVLPSAGAPATSNIWAVGADSAATIVSLDSFNAQTNMITRRANGTAASPTALASGNLIFQFAARGYGATGYSTGARAQFTFDAAENWTDTAQGTYMRFNTTQIGTATLLERMRLTDAGNLGIGNTPSGTYKLEVTGSGYFSTSLTVNTDLTVNGNTTLGDASGDTVTFNASTVSTPNGLNFDSNTLVIDHTNNRIGVGTASPGYPLDVSGTLNIAPSNTSGEQLGIRLFDAGTGASEGLNITWESTNRADMASINGLGDGTGGKFQLYTNGAATGTATLAAEIDQNGYIFNYAGVANTRNSKSIVPGYQYFRLNGNLAGGNDTTTRAIFGVGCSVLANTVYEFEISVNFRKSAGAVTHAFRLAFGGTMGVGNILYNVWAGTIQTTLNSVDAGAPTASVDTATITTVTDNVGTATVASVGMLIKGTISVNTAGTFIPQYALTAAPGGAYSTIAGSYVKVTPLGASGANINIGSWA